MISIGNVDKSEQDKSMIHTDSGLPLIFGNGLVSFLANYGIQASPYDTEDPYVAYPSKHGTYDRIFLINNEYHVQRMPEDDKLNTSTFIIKHADYVTLSDWIRRDRI